MCTTCGCSPSEPHHAHHAHHAHHDDEGAKRLIEVEQDLLAKNNRYAKANRDFIAKDKVLALNFVSSPGAGKTSLLVETINALASPENIGVIEGDQQTDHDAERIKATGAEAYQINTGKGCHLDAHAVGHAVEHFDISKLNYMFIENVGNLVCPSAFDLGEYAKVVVLSVTEGDDKPLKYPDMFKAASLMIINKIDLAPYVDFDIDQSIDYARRVNPNIEVLQLSAKTKHGFDEWLSWLENALAQVETTSDKKHNQL